MPDVDCLAQKHVAKNYERFKPETYILKSQGKREVFSGSRSIYASSRLNPKCIFHLESVNDGCCFTSIYHDICIYLTFPL